MIKTYYSLIKPGIVYSNALTAVAAFLFASHHEPNVWLLLSMLGGITLSIASACVFNNVLDRDIDAKMERTKNRAIPAGRVSVKNALIFATLLGVFGGTLLLFHTNVLTFFVTLFGVLVYLGLYTPLKRLTVHGTLLGAVSGAIPPVIGYTAVTNSLDVTALILFLILVSWQMVHFFAIAIYRLHEYRAADIPVFPVRRGIPQTKGLMLVYVVLFAFANFALHASGAASTHFTSVMLSLSVVWFVFAVQGFWTKDDRQWARRMFLYSLIVILVLSFVLAVY